MNRSGPDDDRAEGPKITPHDIAAERLGEGGASAREASPSEELARTDLVGIGRFRCPPQHPRFRDSASPMRSWDFVFPRTSVKIAHVGREPFVTDANVVTFYNRGQEYVREAVSAEGDACEWFSVDPQVVVETVARYEPRVTDTPEAPFPFTHGPSDPTAYLVQRLLVLHASREAEPDRLLLDEGVLWLLDRVVGDRLGPRRPAAAPGRADRERTEHVRAVLAERYADGLSLGELAVLAECSVSHLCHAFGRVTGSSVHAYRTQLRLRRALELVAEGSAELTDVALDLGFSSHSHFTETFRRAFGAPPSRLRGRLSAGVVRRLLARSTTPEVPPPTA